MKTTNEQKNTFSLKLLLSCLLLAPILTTASYSQALKPIPANFMTGAFGNTPTPPNQVTRYALIDKTGKTKAFLPYQQVSEFHEGLAAFAQNDKFGFINTDGKIVIPPQFTSVSDFSCGLACAAAISDDKGKSGYIDSTGKFKIQPTYDVANDFYSGYARVANNTTTMLIDKNANVIKMAAKTVPITNYSLKDCTLISFEDQIVAIKDKQYSILKLPKNVVPNSNYSEGLCSVKYGPENQFNDYVDTKGQFVTSGRFIEAFDFKNGLAVVRLPSNKLGYIDKTGKFVIAAIYDDALSFSEGIAAVRLGKRSFFIDRQGRTVIKPGYYLSGEFSEGLAPVNKYGKYGYMDKTGQILIKPQYIEAHPFKNGVALVSY